MKILLVSATEPELLPCKNHSFKNHSIDFLITGVGMIATSYYLTKQLQNKAYDLLINLGIAGCFNKTVELGTVFQVEKDSLSELGAENGETFISIEDLGFGKSVFNNDFKIDGVSTASSITVNTIHGKTKSILEVQKRLSSDLESMEGAALAFVCEQEQQKYLQVRSVSNYVEQRDKSKWNIPLAIENLNSKVIQIIETL